MKAFSAMAGLHYGLTSETASYYCTGEWSGFGEGDVQHCWLLTGHGGIDLHRGIVVSCDVVFYEIAKAFYNAGQNPTSGISETALQEYYMKFNLGSNTGIDLSDEVAGRIPTPEWKAEQWKNVPSQAQWRAGDYSNMIIGQGDVLLTPLQLAAAYCGVASGKIMKPHLVSEVRNLSGETVLKTEPEQLVELDFETEYINFVRNALHDVILQSEELAPTFEDLELDAAGKTGTAEHANENPDALFVGYAPYDNPKYVCACVLQHGNSAQQDAAPIVGNVLKAAIESETNGEMEVGKINGYAGEELITGINIGNSTGARGD